MVCAVAAVTVLLHSPASDAGSDSPLDRAAQAAKTQINALKPAGLPGALVGLALGSGEARRIASGVASVETRMAIRTDHRMRIGSVAKLVVATLVLQLVDEGKLRLDDPISKYVADIPHGDRITLRMLGTHTSGVFNPLADANFRKRINANPGAERSFAEVMRVVRDNADAAEPGKTFAYSNGNTMLLARAIEAVTSQTLADVIEERIHRAFGIRTPVMPVTAALPDADLRGYRFGARSGAIEYGTVFFDATGFSASWAGAAGNMNATLDDLLILAKPLATGATLSKASRSVLHDFEPVAHGFGYGFHIAWFGEAAGHAGDVPGFSSFVAWMPRHDLSIVVLCNLSNMPDKRAPAEIIGRAVIKALGAPGDKR